MSAWKGLVITLIGAFVVVAAEEVLKAIRWRRAFKDAARKTKP